MEYFWVLSQGSREYFGVLPWSNLKYFGVLSWNNLEYFWVFSQGSREYAHTEFRLMINGPEANFPPSPAQSPRMEGRKKMLSTYSRNCSPKNSFLMTTWSPFSSITTLPIKRAWTRVKRYSKILQNTPKYFEMQTYIRTLVSRNSSTFDTS